ncbi:MAG: FAD-linked oxidase C-terminal domain-containing protein [Tenuifilum sp.]|uniref:FAD-binding and (Fe-S)-binding domain-containing protein n=1 Tax=Tenuifilum sp. TaxID=2760880 RepID=UPI002C63E3A0|nr:FAD-linked oxidase C-terminal domain-containing protein [Tenuifilum sp.]HOK85646.1 FAD-linked oxidase C-terminal domain-containing protein [Tenuifilum sp.]HON70521.1 FAD-linked oxidase C-terminal domain-containing protein [Tenuifilum sp.]HPP90050.1 FAD-linked oxidase C-terminal domain-containing protein [Tenuifilum sp.]HQG72234.1 FAD-linked oxidase C-terminal domain-containing protein [Tenuifilum sp.]
MKDLEIKINELSDLLSCEVKWDESTLIQYSTDASAYKEKPYAVVWPQDVNDIQQVIRFAKKHKIPVIPRAAGTSLAGQVVGKGIIIDISKHFRRFINLDIEKRRVTVEPGVILDELNLFLKPHGLFFGPETSTSNRCTLSGMVGNNSCGSHSLVYGSTRDHLYSVKMVLDDGNEYLFGEVNKTEYDEKLRLSNREGDIYRYIHNLIGNEQNQKLITSNFPDPSVKRRNTGYALDTFIGTVAAGGELPLNLAKLIAGSEGTFGIITEITLNLVPLPPKEKAVVAVHLKNRTDAFKANLIALKHKPWAVELMDNIILDCTKGNIEQQKNRFFVQGDPGAILIVEFFADSKGEIESAAQKMESDMREAGYGYHFPIIWGAETSKVWNLRKAGLGVLSNVVGDAKPVSLIEDTAVPVERLPEYMDDFEKIMQRYGLECVYHAHIGTGELHLRPVLNLKDPKDVELFHTIGYEVAMLVKKYKGSLSGEHGDGRLRGEFIPIFYGEEVYQLMRELKFAFDPDNIFNPGKIIDTPPMNSSLRYIPGQKERVIDTIFDFSSSLGIIRATEKCNGSGDCRKTHLSGGTLCPSYMATLNEANTTRARANLLREFLSYSPKRNPFNQRELYEILDLCLSCKGCKNECPSSVDMAKLKAEFLQHWYDANGIPIRSRMVAYIAHINRMGSYFPRLTNWFLSNKVTSKILMQAIGFEPKRKMPLLGESTLKKWFKRNRCHSAKHNGKVYLLPDEFTNYNDVHIGIKAVELLNRLGYEVELVDIFESGRTYISKGLVRTAKRIANSNIEKLSGIINPDTPLIGIEPSAILSFRDEYPDLVSQENKQKANSLAENSLLFEEFFIREAAKGRINPEMFTTRAQHIKLHGHCQQKAIASTTPTKAMLSFPVNYTVEEIPSGCCGMAGAFGYEKEHYDLSMKVGELVLFPEIRKTPLDTIISAPGTSCRHQIKDGTGRKALHPIEVMWEALV